MHQKTFKITIVLALLSLSIMIPSILVSAKRALWVLDPFVIDDSTDTMKWSDWVTQPWCTGSGTEEDPYVIQDVMINGEGSSFCLLIMNSAVFFMIKDCVFYNTKPSDEERNAGLALVATQNGKVCNNKFLSNGWTGLGVAAGVALLYCSNIIIQKNEICNNAGPGIYLEYSNENLIIQNHCSKNEGAGISVGWSSSNQIIDNICQKNEQGIILFNECTDNSLESNTCSDNEKYGIQIMFQSNYNRLSDNYCTKNLLSGILLGASNGNIVSNNRCSKNGESGISIKGLYDMSAENNVIYNNYIEKNLKGISFSRVLNNDIFMNTIKNNVYGVILDWECYNNLVYHNNFIHNTVDAWDATDLYQYNLWYHPCMLEGNYWSDYSGKDLNGDGIGDTLLPASRLDYYPFVEKDGWLYLTETEKEILSVVIDPEANRLGGDRTVNSSETSYLIIGLGQALSERTNTEWSPPYTVDVNFYGVYDVIFQGIFWYFDDEGLTYSEPVLWEYFYLIIPPNQIDLPKDQWHYFDWWISFYSYGEYNEWTLRSYFYLI